MGISIWQLLIILLIIIVLFGTKKLRNIGGDLGSAIKNFRQSMRDGESDEELPQSSTQAKMTQENKGQVIDGQVTAKETNKA